MIPRLLAITPPRGPVAATCVEVSLDLGIELSVLLREPDANPAQMLRLDARMGTLLRAARAGNVPVLGSCRAQDAETFSSVARDAGLRGLQLRGDPSEDELLRARSAWPEAILGASVHGDARVVSADYVVFAPVFAPRTAAGFAKRPRGLEPLTTWSARHPRVFALGGVTPQTAGLCAASGAYGVAGISTFLGSEDAVADTLRALARVLTSPPDVPPRPRG